MSASAAFLASAFFSFQPLLWGHAFINPKDPPFLTFFLASICCGFEMVDAIAQDSKGKTKKILLAAFFLGIATSIRVLGPLAGLIVFIYFLFTMRETKSIFVWRSFFYYGLLSILVMFATWPFLWESPIRNFIDVFRLMSDNPTNLSVLFNGEIYRAGDLPRRYFPFMLAVTLTEPTLPVFVIGVIAGYWKLFRERQNSKKIISLSLILFWFFVPVAYILIRRPAMYDGIRHFLFVLPPLFIFTGFVFEFPRRYIQSFWLRASLFLLLLLPGIVGSVQLHPYQYTYYNSFVGGTNGAFRRYETDYWLTCYKESVERLNQRTSEPAALFVKREAYIAATYANNNIRVRELRGALNEVDTGDYVLIGTRTNEDRSTYRDAPIVVEVKRGDATFCIVRQIP
jgi:4-amino-4-deoxy-L-arabinose transferase-like glycosyltransferase